MVHPEALAIYAFARLRQIDSGGFINGVKTSSIHSGTQSYPIVYPDRALSVFIGALGVSDLLAAALQNNSSFIWHAG